MTCQLAFRLCRALTIALSVFWSVTEAFAQNPPWAQVIYEGTFEYPWEHHGVQSWGGNWESRAVVDAQRKIVEEINKQVNLLAFMQWVSKTGGQSIDISTWVDITKGGGGRIQAAQSAEIQSFQGWINANNYLSDVRNERIKPGTAKTKTRDDFIHGRSWDAWAVMLYDLKVWGKKQGGPSSSPNQSSITAPPQGSSLPSSRPTWAFVEAAGLYRSKPVVVSGQNAYDRAKKMAATAGGRLPTLDECRMAWPVLSQYSDCDKWFFVFFTDTPGVQWMPLPVGIGKAHGDKGRYNGLDLLTYVAPVAGIASQPSPGSGGSSGQPSNNPGSGSDPGWMALVDNNGNIHQVPIARRSALVGTWIGADGRRLILNADGTGTTWIGDQRLSYQWFFSESPKRSTFQSPGKQPQTMEIISMGENSFTVKRPDGTTNTYTRQ